MWESVIVAVSLVSIYATYIIYIVRDKRLKYKTLLFKHVVVTGGSSGIGKAAAMEAAKLGAHVTIIGRDEKKLETAAKEILSKCPDQDNQIIQFAVLDVTAGYDPINECFSKIEDEVGPIFMLVNCAGACICGLFEDMLITDIHSMITLNYLGTAYPTRSVLTKMKRRNEGIVVFVASEAAMVGIYGYSAYSAAKWAVRGLAEAINMELVGTPVRTMISYPPDTDTPGLQAENLTKPEVTKLISGSGGLHSPESVGKALIRDALAGKAYSVYSASGYLLNTLYGISFDSVGQIVAQIFLSGALRAVMIGIFSSFHRIIRFRLHKRIAELRNQGLHP